MHGFAAFTSRSFKEDCIRIWLIYSILLLPASGGVGLKWDCETQRVFRPIVFKFFDYVIHSINKATPGISLSVQGL